MPLIINTNVGSLNAQTNLARAGGELGKTLSRLSSGFRINRAADDAAGLAISNEMVNRIKATNVNVQNAQDGIALLNVADGAANEIVNNISRMRELAKQAGNDTYDTAKRNLIKVELDQLKSEITRVANATEFNGVKLINAAAPTNFFIQVGQGNNTTATSTDILNIAAAFGNLVASTGGLLLGTTDVTTATKANALASRLDTGLTTVNTKLANIGAITNRLEGTIRSLQTYGENLSAANSRIRDTDVALETSKLTRYQILQQAAQSMLAQANAAPQSALQLLQ